MESKNYNVGEKCYYLGWEAVVTNHSGQSGFFNQFECYDVRYKLENGTTKKANFVPHIDLKKIK